MPKWTDKVTAVSSLAAAVCLCWAALEANMAAKLYDRHTRV